MKLIPMTDYVLESKRFKEDSDTAIFKVTNYAQFLKQPLKLGMFIPCDEDGNILKLPIEIKEDAENWNYQARFNQYIKAKELVYFEDFKVIDRGNFYFIEREDSSLFYRLFKNNTKKNLESLIKVWDNVILTKSISEILGYEI